MKLTLAIPTFNNYNQLVHALISLVRNTDFDGRLIVINNGDERIGDESFADAVRRVVPYHVEMYQAEANLGWCGGINAALGVSDSELFCMCNDDVLFPPNRQFWKRVYSHFALGWVGGVGPISNYVSGYQNMILQGMPDLFTSPLLIGFCAVYRRDVLGEGLDETLPGGDDYDLSIRVTKQKLGLIVDRTLFVHHYGSQTGKRIHQDYWDSDEHQLATINAIARKHGLAAWYECMNGEIRELGGSQILGNVTLDGLYHDARRVPSDIYEHLDVLRTLAESVEHVTEFGVHDGTTTTAFLAAQPKRVVSYDINRDPNIDVLASVAGKTSFEFNQRSTLAGPIEETDLLFIDDLHTYSQVSQELAMHAGSVRKYIAFHDVSTLGYHDETGPPWAPPPPDPSAKQGIMPAISEFLREHPEWRIVQLFGHNNGLMVLARVR